MSDAERILREEAGKAERDAADLLRRQGFPDASTAWRDDADAAEAETRRLREARRDRRERERNAAIDQRIAAALERERAFLEEAIGQAIAGFVATKVRPIEQKLDELERLLKRLGRHDGNAAK